MMWQGEEGEEEGGGGLPAAARREAAASVGSAPPGPDTHIHTCQTSSQRQPHAHAHIPHTTCRVRGRTRPRFPSLLPLPKKAPPRLECLKSSFDLTFALLACSLTLSCTALAAACAFRIHPFTLLVTRYCRSHVLSFSENCISLHSPHHTAVRALERSRWIREICTRERRHTSNDHGTANSWPVDIPTVPSI